MMYRLRSNESSFLDLFRPFGCDLLIRFEALVNHPHRPDRRARLHGAHTHSVIVADNRYLIASLRLRNGTLWYQQRVSFHAGLDTHTSILAGTQNVAGIGKGSNDANRARARIHLPISEQDSAFLRVDTPVGQHQLERVSEEIDGVFAGTGIALTLREKILVFGNRKKNLDWIDLRNGSQNGAGPDQVADLDLCDPSDSINERDDFGPLQVEFRLLHCRLSRFNRRLCTKLGLNFVI